MKAKIENPTAQYYGNGRMSAQFEKNGCRFHVWLAPNGSVEKDILYKNPPLDLNRHDAGYFQTRYLSASNAANKPIVDELLSSINKDEAIARYEAKEQDERAKRDAEMVAKEALDRLNEAAPDLLAIVQSLADEDADGVNRSQWRRESVRAVLAKIGGA